MVDTLADDMQQYYASQLGHQGSLIELEREYFQAAANETWADAALQFYGEANGSNPVGSLNDEIFKYYSQRSGLSPAANYSTADHMLALFGGGGGHALTPPITDQLEAFFDASAIDGYQSDARVSKNLLGIENSTFASTVGTWVVSATCTIARSTTTAAHGDASLAVTSTGAGSPSFRTPNGVAAITNIPVVAGRTYSFSYEVKAAVTGRVVTFTAAFVDAAGGFISSASVGTGLTSNTSTWSTNRGSAVAPEGAVGAYLICGFQSAAGAGEIQYYDKFGYWEGTSTDWVLPGKLHNVNLLTYDEATFETSIVPWVNNVNATVARSTAQAKSGSASLSLTAIAASAMSAAMSLPLVNGIPVLPNKTYTAVASYRAAVTGRTALTQLRFFDSAGILVTNNSGTAITDTTAGWTVGSVTAVSPSDAVYALLFVHITGTAAISEVHYVDEVGLWEGYQTEWVPPFRGSALIDGSPVNFWRDISGKNRHAVQNTAANQPLYRKSNPNLLTYNQATVETDTTGFGTPFNCTIARSTAQKIHGIASIEATVTVASTPTVSLLAGALGVPIDISKTYTAVVSSYIGAGAGRTIACRMYWYKSDGSASSTAFTAGTGVVLTAATWAQSTVTAQPPSDAAYCQVRAVTTAGSVIADVIYFDNWMLTEGSDVAWKPPVTLGNSKPAVQFDGMSDAMTAVFAALDLAAMTIYAVVIRDYEPASTNRRIFQGVSGSTFYLYAATGGGAVASAFGAAFVSAGALGVNNRGVASAVARTTESQTYLNGTGGSIMTTDPSGTTGTSLDIGHTAGGAWFPGCIDTILIYSGTHTDAQRQQIERWLGARYGVTVA